MGFSRQECWVAISSSRGSSQFRNQTCISCTGMWILYHWATWPFISWQFQELHLQQRPLPRTDHICRWQPGKEGRKGGTEGGRKEGSSVWMSKTWTSNPPPTLPCLHFPLSCFMTAPSFQCLRPESLESLVPLLPPYSTMVPKLILLALPSKSEDWPLSSLLPFQVWSRSLGLPNVFKHLCKCSNPS